MPYRNIPNQRYRARRRSRRPPPRRRRSGQVLVHEIVLQDETPGKGTYVSAGGLGMQLNRPCRVKHASVEVAYHVRDSAPEERIGCAILVWSIIDSAQQRVATSAPLMVTANARRSRLRCPSGTDFGLYNSNSQVIRLTDFNMEAKQSYTMVIKACVEYKLPEISVVSTIPVRHVSPLLRGSTPVPHRYRDEDYPSTSRSVSRSVSACSSFVDVSTQTGDDSACP